MLVYMCFNTYSEMCYVEWMKEGFLFHYLTTLLKQQE